MEKRLKKSDWSKLTEKFDLLDDLRDHLTISITKNPFTHKGFTNKMGTIPDKTFDLGVRKVAKGDNDRRELFARKWLEYQTKYDKPVESVFIESEIKETSRLIVKVEAVKKIDKNDLYIEAKEYLNFLKHKQTEHSDSEADSYILKHESVINRLFEEYGSYFIGETNEVWKQRWIDGNDTLIPITIDDFKKGNNKHLLLTILNEAAPFMKVVKIEDYIKRRWGLKSYHSNISKYINNSLRDPKFIKHPETNKIKEILKPEHL